MARLGHIFNCVTILGHVSQYVLRFVEVGFGVLFQLSWSNSCNQSTKFSTSTTSQMLTLQAAGAFLRVKMHTNGFFEESTALPIPPTWLRGGTGGERGNVGAEKRERGGI